VITQPVGEPSVPPNTGPRESGPGDSGEVVIRTAVGDDLDAVIEIGHRTWPGTFEPIAGPEYVEMGLAKWWTADATIPAIRTGRTLVAEVGGEVVGMTVYGPHEDDLVLWKLYVLPDHHGRGIGHRLLEAALERAHELEHTRMSVSVVDGNDRAMRFYERHGFREVEREPGGSGLPDSVWMAKDLAPRGPEVDA
jgi:ribosomal protein S18 acetylase RimI-like enzyme